MKTAGDLLTGCAKGFFFCPRARFRCLAKFACIKKKNEEKRKTLCRQAKFNKFDRCSLAWKCQEKQRFIDRVALHPTSYENNNEVSNMKSLFSGHISFLRFLISITSNIITNEMELSCSYLKA